MAPGRPRRVARGQPDHAATSGDLGSPHPDPDHAPSTQANTDVGFRAESSANGSLFAGFAYFGNYTTRQDGPGKVFDFNGISNTTIENIWVEHMVCLYWGANTDNMTLRNNRIRHMFADGINMTNGSSGNLVSNNEARATGDDSFALFNAQDGGGGEVTAGGDRQLVTTRASLVDGETELFEGERLSFTLHGNGMATVGSRATMEGFRDSAIFLTNPQACG